MCRLFGSGLLHAAAGEKIFVENVAARAPAARAIVGGVVCGKRMGDFSGSSGKIVFFICLGHLALFDRLMQKRRACHCEAQPLDNASGRCGRSCSAPALVAANA